MSHGDRFLDSALSRGTCPRDSLMEGRRGISLHRKSGEPEGCIPACLPVQTIVLMIFTQIPEG